MLNCAKRVWSTAGVVGCSLTSLRDEFERSELVRLHGPGSMHFGLYRQLRRKFCKV